MIKTATAIDYILAERDDFALMPRLRTAVVCLDGDCECIFPRSLKNCPACGSDQSFPLVNWIEKSEKEIQG